MSFLKSQWFLLALTAALVAGWFGSDILQPVAEAAWLRNGIVATVLFLMALPIAPAGILGGIRRPLSGFLALGINVLVLPLAATAGYLVLDEANAAGLLVAAIVPCTLASATVWTRRAGGDTSIAMLTTIVTNAACFLVAPFWLTLLLGKSAQIDASEQIIKLFVLVVLPMSVAQVLRIHRGIAALAIRWKIPFSTLAQVGILSMVTIGVVQMRLRVEGEMAESELTLAAVVVVCAAAAVLHTVMLGAGWLAAKMFRLDRADQIAVAIAGSQKTLMIGLQLSIDVGVSILPMIAYHIGQLFIDTIFADRVKEKSTGHSFPKSD